MRVVVLLVACAAGAPVVPSRGNATTLVQSATRFDDPDDDAVAYAEDVEAPTREEVMMKEIMDAKVRASAAPVAPVVVHPADAEPVVFHHKARRAALTQQHAKAQEKAATQQQQLLARQQLVAQQQFLAQQQAQAQQKFLAQQQTQAQQQALSQQQMQAQLNRAQATSIRMTKERQRLAYQNAALAPGLHAEQPNTRPKGWGQCLQYARFLKSKGTQGEELVRAWTATCSPAVQSGIATERYRLMCNAMGGAVRPFAAQVDYAVEQLCDSVLAVFHDLTATDVRATST